MNYQVLSIWHSLTHVSKIKILTFSTDKQIPKRSIYEHLMGFDIDEY